MTNDINRLNGAGSFQRSVSTEQSKSDKSPESKTDAGIAGTDSVKISQQARQLNDVQQAIAHTPDIDAKKIEEIRQSLENGQYEINSGNIAEKMLEMNSLFGEE